MLKVRTLFSGIGSPEIALRNLQIPFEIVDFCEVDKYAVQSYCAIHGVDARKNLGDITKVWGRNLPYADLLVWGFPCQDISVAGKQRGLKEGETRSGLYYEGFRILKETKPKYSIIENVKNLAGKKFKADFKSMLEDIESIGYNNYWKVLNAKDYGIPQNRERVFIVSIRKDVDTGTFSFPQGFDNGLRLKDLLEDEVEEKYYINQEKTEKLIRQLKDNPYLNKNKNYTPTEWQTAYPMNSQDFVRTGFQDASYTLSARDYKDPKIVCVPCLTPDRIEKRQNSRRFKEDGEPMFTLTGQDRHGVLQIGNGMANGKRENPNQGRVYDAEGISPSLTAMEGGGRQPHIVEPQVLRPERTEYGKVIRKQYEAGEIQESRHNMTELQPREDGISNTLTTVQKDNLLLEPIVAVKEATKKGYAEATVGDSINIQFPNSETRRGRVGQGVAQTLETSCNQAVIVPDKPVLVGGIGEINFGKQYRQGNRVYSSDAPAMCLLSQPVGNTGGNSYLYEVGYRIRKLTPKECWRLMGFKDTDFEKAVAAGVSNSQLYKQAGNSIVTNVLFHIFKNLLQVEISQIYEDNKELS